MDHHTCVCNEDSSRDKENCCAVGSQSEMACDNKTLNYEFGLFLIRIALALVFIYHGWSKFENMHGTIAFFTSLKLPSIMAFFIPLIELLSGLALLLGLLTRYAALLIVAVMIFAIVMVKMKKGFGGGYEFELTLFLVALSIVFTGAGSYTVKLFCNSKK